MKRRSVGAAVVLTIVLGFGLLGCGNSNTGTEGSSANKETETTSSAETTSNSANYPKKDIEIVVPYAAGGSTDMVARAFAQVLSNYLPNNVNIAVVNVTGGNNIVGTQEVYSANPDGYTIGCIAAAPLSIVPLYGETEFTHDSFETIAQVTSIAQVLAVSANSEWNTIEDVITYAKENPNAFTYGVGGKTNVSNLALSYLMMQEGVQMKSVVYNGNSEVLTAFLGGHVNAYTGAATDIKEYVESGEAKILLNMGFVVEDFYADATTMEDLGYESVGDAYTGFIAPPDTPDEIMEILETAFEKAMEDETLLATYANIGIQPVFLNRAEFQELISQTFERNKEVLKYLGEIE